MTIQIRPYRSSDDEFIMSLVPRFSAFELPEWRAKEEIDHTNQEYMRQALSQPEAGSAIFVAEEEGALAGFILLQTQIDYFNGEKVGYVSDLVLNPSFEGQGIGRLLLETAEAWARMQGYGLLALYVFAGNQRARQLYVKYGFQQEVIKYVKVLGTASGSD